MIDPKKEIAEIKNIGPYSVKLLNSINIFSVEDLLNTSYLKIWNDLMESGVKPHLLMFDSIEMGIQGRKWNDITANEKQEIKELLQLV
jgi:hypothetical protein